ncbi:MAG: FAD-dependent oxidoreductase [Rhodopseudomonas palustris]|nr:FAD-dependent oxidoreductase [Rhodopseudomonas palustris]
MLTGVDFLKQVKLGRSHDVAGRKVAVVGGGNTAIDAARTAVGLKADHVTIYYRRTRKEMPANVEEIEAAEAEGVRLEYLIAPVEVVADGETLKGLVVQTMRLGEPDSSGRRRPVPVEGSQHLIHCDIVIGAIGQQVDLLGLVNTQQPLKVTRWGTLEADSYSCATSLNGVFAGGDAVTGPAVAIEAIGWGRRAALSIRQYLETGRPARFLEKFSSRRENFGDIPKSDLPEAAAFPRAHQGSGCGG